MTISRVLSGALLAAGLALPGAAALADPSETNLNLFAGQKYLDEDDWDPVENQDAFGIAIDHEPEGWWMGATIGFYNSSDDSMGTLAGSGNPAELTADVWEIAVGPSKVFRIPGVPMRVYVGGGYAYMSGTIRIEEFLPSGDSPSSRDSGSGHGVWAGTRVLVTIAEQINLGLEARISRGEVSIGGSDLEAGGESAGAVIGLHF